MLSFFPHSKESTSCIESPYLFKMLRWMGLTCFWNLHPSLRRQGCDVCLWWLWWPLCMWVQPLHSLCLPSAPAPSTLTFDYGPCRLWQLCHDAPEWPGHHGWGAPPGQVSATRPECQCQHSGADSAHGDPSQGPEGKSPGRPRVHTVWIELGLW